MRPTRITSTRALSRTSRRPVLRSDIRKMIGRLLAVLRLLLFSLTCGAAESPSLRSGVFSPPRVAPDFSLLGSDGSALKLSRYRGKVVALGFGYSSCPDVCPTTLFYLAQ